MIDRSFSGRAPMLRAPDLRLSDVETQIFSGARTFPRLLEAPGRSIFVYVLEGTFECAPPAAKARARIFEPGTAVGVEDGRGLHWRVRGKAAAAARLFVSSIPRRIAVLQKLTGGMIVVPPGAEPFASTIRLAVALHIEQSKRLGEHFRDDPVVNRCAEICLIQFIDFACAGLAAQAPAPAPIAHDQQLLAAWTAYFAEPQRRWTVKALADAAGLGRTAFAQRFRDASGAPPLQTLTALRLEQAETMLRDTRAPLIEIAFTVGYNSEAAFVRAFQRRFGITPGRFRAGAQGRERLGRERLGRERLARP